MSDVFFSLNKDVSFDLDKLSPGTENFYVGLSWTPSTEGDDVDLDAVLVATNDSGKVVSGLEYESFLYYSNHGREGLTPKAFWITPDDQDGTGVEADNTVDEIAYDYPDNEAIFIYGAKVNDAMKELHVYVTFHEAGMRTLKDVKDVTLTIAPLLDDDQPDLSSGKVAKFTVSDIGASKGGHIAIISRNPMGGWDIKAVGEQSGELEQVMIVHGLKKQQ